MIPFARRYISVVTIHEPAADGKLMAVAVAEGICWILGNCVEPSAGRSRNPE